MKRLKGDVAFLLTAGLMICSGTTVFALPSGLNVNANSATEFNGIGSTVLGYIQWFGYAMAVGMLLYVGIKYMMAPANEKADLKKASINYVIGAIIIAAATAIVSALVSIGSGFGNSAGKGASTPSGVQQNATNSKY
mgnify:FL=1